MTTMTQKTWTEDQIVALVNENEVAAMRAVCALFRQQTMDERRDEATKYLNGRGFSASDAKIGSELALWMTRGFHDGQMRRRVGGATKFAGAWMTRSEVCRQLALKYRAQLTRIANARAAFAKAA